MCFVCLLVGMCGVYLHFYIVFACICELFIYLHINFMFFSFHYSLEFRSFTAAVVMQGMRTLMNLQISGLLQKMPQTVTWKWKRTLIQTLMIHHLSQMRILFLRRKILMNHQHLVLFLLEEVSIFSDFTSLLSCIRLQLFIFFCK